MKYRTFDRHRRIERCLADQPEQVRREVRDAIDRLVENPRNVMTRVPQRPIADRVPPDARIAVLPHGWTLVYRIVDGLPPAQMDARVLIVHDFLRLVP